MAKHIKPFLSLLTTGVAIHAFCYPGRFPCIENSKVNKPALELVEYEDMEMDDNYEINNKKNRNEDAEAEQEELLRYFFNKLGNKIPIGIRMMKRGGRHHKSDRRTRDGRIRDGRIRLLKHQF